MEKADAELLIWLRKKGLEVFLSDKGAIKDNYKQFLTDNEIEFEEGNHDEERILNADWIVKSPGIPKKADIIHKIHEKGIRLSSEIEFASEFTDAKDHCHYRKQRKNNHHVPDLLYPEK